MNSRIEIKLIGKMFMPQKHLEYFEFQAAVRIEAELIDIGRMPQLTPCLILDFTGVSNRQAKLFYKNNQWYVEDSGSDNGTWLIAGDSQTLADVGKPLLLQETSLIRFGTVVAEVKISG